MRVTVSSAEADKTWGEINHIYTKYITILSSWGDPMLGNGAHDNKIWQDPILTPSLTVIAIV